MGDDQPNIFSGTSSGETYHGYGGADTIAGNGGDDVLYGDDGDDIIRGGDGADRIDPGLGADQAFGDDGDDTFVFSSIRFEFPRPTSLGLLDGGTGRDTIDFSALSVVTLGTIETAPGTYTLGAYVGSQKYEIRDVERILFGAGNDYIALPSSFDRAIELHGGGGADAFTVAGRAAAFGDDGDDTFFLSGSFGGATRNGSIDGGAGRDLLKLNIAFSVDLAAGTARAGTTSFTIASIEQVQAAANYGYQTTVLGSNAAEDFSVNPLFNDGSVGVIFDGRGGNDRLSGSAGNDHITGGSGDDVIAGGAGTDTLIGGAGHDAIQGGAGDDLIDGGVGLDTVSYADAAGAVAVDLRQAIQVNAATGTDRLVSIENVTGSAFGDVLTGDDAANVLSGNDGADIIRGLLGANVIDGGGGIDTVSYDWASSGVTVSLGIATTQFTGLNVDRIANVENLAGSRFGDRLTGDAGVNRLEGGDGDDILDGGLGDDAVIGGAGIDTVNYATARGAVSASLSSGTASGAAGSDTIALIENLTGSNFNDQLAGDDGANLIVGGAGSDLLAGGGGDDRLIGGLARDVLTGGAGVDTFVYTATTESISLVRDLITDLAAEDVIDLTQIDADTRTTGNQSVVLAQALTGVAGQLVLQYDSARNLTTLRGDVNGDGVADLVIDMTGDTAAFASGWLL